MAYLGDWVAYSGSSYAREFTYNPSHKHAPSKPSVETLHCDFHPKGFYPCQVDSADFEFARSLETRDLLSLPRMTVVEFEALVKTRNQNDLIIKHGPMRILVQRESFWMGDF